MLNYINQYHDEVMADWMNFWGSAYYYMITGDSINTFNEENFPEPRSKHDKKVIAVVKWVNFVKQIKAGGANQLTQKEFNELFQGGRSAQHPDNPFLHGLSRFIVRVISSTV